MTSQNTDLFGNNLATRQRAWSRSAIRTFKVEDKVTVKDGLKELDLLTDLEKVPLKAHLENGDIEDTNRYAIYRKPTKQDRIYRQISDSVGKDYDILQPKIIAKSFQKISKEFPVETIGVTNEGKKLFMTLNLGNSKIANEDHELYWLIVDSRDGQGKFQMCFTPIRIVCQNALVSAEKSSSVSLGLSHKRGINSEVLDFSRMFNQLLTKQEDTIQAMNSMATNKLKKEDVTEIIEYAYEEPKVSEKIKNRKHLELNKAMTKRQLEDFNIHEKKISSIQNIRENAMNRYNVFNDEFPKLARSSWAVYNAVVETEDFRRTRGTSATSFIPSGKKAMNKARAYSKALQFVG
tara:strand:- start:1744 stop:2790 length:1047 start_codon:yes stop_codon:yes gene_type:complete